jgi:molybdopterin molybdotransferase
MPLPWRDLAAALTGSLAPIDGVETLTLRNAAGRVLAADLEARHPLPAHHDHAVMDGYALGSDPPGAYRVLSEAAALQPGEAMVVQAGRPVPENTARVVLARHAVPTATGIKVKAASGKDNIRRIGEECSVGDVILRAGIRLDARHLALAAATGAASLPLRRRPRVALLALADGAEPLPHLAVMTALLSSTGLRLTEVGTVRSGQVRTQLARLAGHDLVVVVAESLGAEEGFMATLLSPRQGRPVVQRAALKPAKPILFGEIAGVPVLGLAGTAYATAAAAHLFLRPMLARLAGLPAPGAPMEAVADFARLREPGRAEALPVSTFWRDGRLHLAPAGRFGQLKALAALDGFGLVDEAASDIAIGSPMAFLPLTMPLI